MQALRPQSLRACQALTGKRGVVHGSRPWAAPRRAAARAAGAGGVDIDSFLEDEEAIAALREKIIKQMAAAKRAPMATPDASNPGSLPAAAAAVKPTQAQRNQPSGGAPGGSTTHAGAPADAGARTPRRGSRQAATPAKARKHSNGAEGDTRDAGSTAIGQAALSCKQPIPVVVLKAGKARLFAGGAPMVYSGAVDRVVGRPAPGIGDTVVVADTSERPVAWGVFNPTSMFRVRIMQTEAEATASGATLDVPTIVDARLAAAARLRVALGLPSAATNVYRLFNSEGDGLSGLVVDVLGSCAVVQSCAGWSERYREAICTAIHRHVPGGVDHIIWRPAADILKQEGVQVDPSTSPTSSGDAVSSSEVERAQPPGSVEPSGSSLTVPVLEGGLRFLAAPYGQKTGFYADQRDNRSFLASICAGQEVLDLCCYSGAFALRAAAAGASSATGVDSSGTAIELAVKNANLNCLQDKCRFEQVKDVSGFLKAAAADGKSWDVVVLDPPKLAPNRSTMERAAIKYRTLNELALAVVKPGGLLMSCSCSGAVAQKPGHLQTIVQTAAQRVGRQLTLVREAGAASDHPINVAYPEGRYLTTLTFRVL